MLDLNGWYVVKEHHATNLHYDLRFGINWIARSWAINSCPTMVANLRMFAREMPDHSMETMRFEGTRRAGLYGAGEVLIWDEGIFEADGDVIQALKKGSVRLTLHGAKLKGGFLLERSESDFLDWDFIKVNDRFADPGFVSKPILRPRKYPGYFPLFEFL